MGVEVGVQWHGGGIDETYAMLTGGEVALADRVSKRGWGKGSAGEIHITHTQTLHVWHICLHWGGFGGQLIGIYGSPMGRRVWDMHDRESPNERFQQPPVSVGSDRAKSHGIDSSLFWVEVNGHLCRQVN